MILDNECALPAFRSYGRMRKSFENAVRRPQRGEITNTGVIVYYVDGVATCNHLK